MTFDARSPTQYGTVRSYVAIGTSNNISGEQGGRGVSYANRWFIQWAGFTIGHSTSFFDFYSIGANQYGFSDRDFGLGRRRLGRVRLYRDSSVTASRPRSRPKCSAGPRSSTPAPVRRFSPRQFSGPLDRQTPQAPATKASDTRSGWQSARRSGLGFGPGHGCVCTPWRPQYYARAPTLASKVAIRPTSWALRSASASSWRPRRSARATTSRLKPTTPKVRRGILNMTALTWDYQMYDGNSYGYGLETDAVFGGADAPGRITRASSSPPPGR